MLLLGNIFWGDVPNVPIRGLMMEKYNVTKRLAPCLCRSLAPRRWFALRWFHRQCDRRRPNQRPGQRQAVCDGGSLWLWVAVALLSTWCVPSPSRAQRQDSFEGGAPRWQLVESDCQAQLSEHEISLLLPHAGRTCEMFEVACGRGRFVLLAYPIEPCVVLNEFQPRLWTRCSSGRIQLGVRVIFPFAEHPVTLGRLNTILWGDLYTDSGQWQMLQVTQLERRLQEAVISLRQEFGSTLNLDGAFIDSLVLNAYTGPGRYRVQIDDLDLRGMVPLTAMGTTLDPDWRERWRWRYATPSREERFWASANRPPVWFQHGGESLAWLKSLGFTGLVLNQLPSEQQLARMRDANLSVISPPPAHRLAIGEDVAPVIKGWLVGAALDGRQADLAREQVRLVEQLPTELRRPLVGEALEQYWMYSRLADEVIVPAPAPHAAGQVTEKFQWLSQQLAITRQRGTGWVSINVGETPATLDQYRTAMQVLGVAQTPTGLQVGRGQVGRGQIGNGQIGEGEIDAREVALETPCHPLGLRQQATSAIMAGAQGILFRAFQPLRSHGGTSDATVAALRWINNDLAVWGPWIMAGTAGHAPTLSRPDYLAKSWMISDSQLIVAQNVAEGSHLCLPATGGTPLQFASPTTQSRQVLRLTHGTLERMQIESSPGGSVWTVARPAPIEVFVISDNPQVIGFLRNQLTAMATQNAADQLEIAAYNLALAAGITSVRFPTNTGASEEPAELRSLLPQLSAAQRDIDRGWQALRANQPSQATVLASQASDSIQAILYDAMQAATANLATPQSSPFVVSPAMLSLHWRLAEACLRSEWQPFPLPGAQLSNLNELLDSGWTQQRRLEEQVDLRVEIVPPTSERGGGLRLAAYGKGNDSARPSVPGGYEGASLRVRSAAAPIEAGRLVRVSAVAHVLRSSVGPESGLLVYDNQAGPSLGQLVRGETGQRIQVELYRFATTDGEFRILAECRGECDIVLEAIQASVIVPATNRMGFPTTPLGEIPQVMVGEMVDSNQP
jgi:hypothetical protein